MYKGSSKCEQGYTMNCEIKDHSILMSKQLTPSQQTLIANLGLILPRNFSKITFRLPKLPILNHKEEIRKLIKSQRVIVVSGNTGCGKSTQVPQYVLEMDPKAKILVAQPRRAACVHLHDRVKQEIQMAQYIKGVKENKKVKENNSNIQENVQKDIHKETKPINQEPPKQEKRLRQKYVPTKTLKVQQEVLQQKKKIISKKYTILQEQLSKPKPNFTFNTQKPFPYTQKAARRMLYKEVLKNHHEDLVGYQISRQGEHTENTQILFVTYGMLLQKILNEHYRNSLDYIILDEVHERSLESDFTLLVLKTLMKSTKFKLIIMSASMNTQLFSDYFSTTSINSIHEKISNTAKCSTQDKIDEMQNWGTLFESNQVKQKQEFASDGAPIVDILTKDNFQIDVYYIEHLQKFFNQANIDYEKSGYDKHDLFCSKYFTRKPILQEQALELCIQSISYIMATKKHKKYIEVAGAALTGEILIFLPGMKEIEEVETQLQAKFQNQIEIIKLHSLIKQCSILNLGTNYRQQRIYLSTNIAESSITLPEVSFVIDFCLQRESNYNHSRAMEHLEVKWSSQAALLQRKGRIGRVAPGVVLRLIPSNHPLPEFPTPSIQNSALKQLFLLAKSYRMSICDEPIALLQHSLDPPCMGTLIYTLKELKQFSLCFNSENPHKQKSFEENTGKFIELNSYGKCCINLPMDEQLSRLILMGTILGCQSSCIDIAVYLALNKGSYVQFSEIKAMRKDEAFHGFRQDLQRRIKDQGWLHKDLERSNARVNLALLATFSKHVSEIRKKDTNNQHILKELAHENKTVDMDKTIIVHDSRLNYHKLPEHKKRQINDQWRRIFELFGPLHENCPFIFLFHETLVQFEDPSAIIKLNEYLHQYKKSVVNVDMDPKIANKRKQINQFLNNVGDIEEFFQLEHYNMLNNFKVTLNDKQQWMADRFKTGVMVTDGFYEQSRDRVLPNNLGHLELESHQVYLIFMIFYPDVTLQQDMFKQRCKKIIINQETEFDFDYELLENDVRKINQIRSTINSFINNRLKDPPDLFEDISDVILKKRKKYYAQEQWQVHFHESKNLPEQSTPIQNKNDFKKRETLPQIAYPKIDNRKDFSEDHQLSYFEYWQEYNQWKKETLAFYSTLDKRIRFQDTSVLCGECDAFICSVQALNGMTEVNSQVKQFFPNVYQIDDYQHEGKREDIRQQIEKQYGKEFSDFAYQQSETSLQFISCKNNHIYGVKKQVRYNEYEFFICLLSNLKLIYPDLETEKFEFSGLDFEKIAAREAEIEKLDFKKITPYCKICCTEFEDRREICYRKHFSGDLHLESIKKFQRSTQYDFKNM